MGSIFRICSIDKDNNDIWNIHLKLIDKENDQELERLADDIWNKIRSYDDLFSFIKLLRLIGHFEKAKEYIDLLLYESVFCDDVQNLALLINEIGLIYEEQGDFAIANVYYEIFIDIKSKRQLLYMKNTLSSTIQRATSQTIEKHIQDMRNENNEELIKLKNSLKKEEKTNVPNRESLADYYQEIGHIYEQQENDTEALKMYKKCVQLFLPTGLFAIHIYSSMALLYAKQNDSSTSNMYIEKTLEEHSHFKSNVENLEEIYRKNRSCLRSTRTIC